MSQQGVFITGQTVFINAESRIFKQQPNQGAYREAVLQPNGEWKLEAGGHLDGKIRVIHDVWYAPKKTRAEAEAWVEELGST